MRTCVFAAGMLMALSCGALADADHDCHQDKNQDLAIRSCTLIIESQAAGKKAYAYYSRGAAYYNKGENDRALSDFNRALELDPKFTDGYHGRGTAYYGNGDYDRAIADFSRAIEIDPKYANAYTGRGATYNRKDDFDRAIADFSRAIELDAKNWKGYAGRGAAYYNKDENDRAIADLSRAIELNPNDAKTYYNRGDAYRDKGETDRAIADFDRAIELNPRDASAYRSRGTAYYKKGDNARATADYNRAIELDPSDPSVYRNRGGHYIDTGQFDLAIEDLTRAIELAPRNASYYNARAWAYFKAGKAAEGLPDAERSLELRPNDAYALDTRAHIFEALGRREEAIADFRRALSKNSKLQESRDGLKRLGIAAEAMPPETPAAETLPAGPPAEPKTSAQSIYRQLEIFGEVLQRIRSVYVDQVDDRELIKNAMTGIAKAVPGLSEDPETKSAINKLSELEPKAGTIYALLEVFGGYVEHVRKTQKSSDSTSGEKLMTAAIGGMLEGLDRHSSYIAGPPCASAGTGVEVKLENGTLRVVSAIDASPAMKAGIRGGDVITHVDGAALSGLLLHEAVARLCGPAGSEVRVTLVREGQSQPIEINIVRQVVRMASVRYSVEGDIGRIKIKNFQSDRTYEHLKQAVEDLQRGTGPKLKGYVIDLRGNSGGLLDQAIKVADAFLENGVIVITRRRDGNKRFTATSGDLTGGKPIAVIIDGGTASGAEAVASCLQDQHRAVVVGVPSFGMASIQTHIPLGDGRAIRLTTARMFRAEGGSWEGKGIQPDIIVQVQPGDDGHTQTDPQLQAALDAIRHRR